MLRRSIVDRDITWAIVACDMNFVDPVEGRWCVRSRAAVHAFEPEAATFGESFGEVAEVAQQSATRRQFHMEDGIRALETVS